MALTLNLKVDRITSDGRIYLKDNTGDYHVTDNPGGYGSPNLARASVALFCFALLKQVAEDVELEITPYTPETVEEFEVAQQEDGWIEFTTVGLQIFENSIADDRFAEGEYVYDVATQEVRQILTSTLNVGVYEYTYSVVEDLTLIRSQDTIINTCNYLHISELCEIADKARDKYLSSFANKIASCAPLDETAKEALVLVESFMQGAVNDFGKLAYYEAQKKIEHTYLVASQYNIV